MSQIPGQSEVGIPEFSVVIPCYNEEAAIGPALDELAVCLGDTTAYEVIVVDDGSTDGSARAIQDAQARHPRLKVFSHLVNRGYGAALKSGIRRSSGELIVITDADGTYPSDRIPDLLRIAEEADMVVGARIGANVKYPMIRRLPKFFLSRYAAWIVGQPIPDMNSGLRVMRRAVVEEFLNILPDSFSFTTTITVATLSKNYDVRFEPISYAPRVGRSKIQPVRDTLRFLQLILRTGMYFAPMRVFFPLALLIGLGFMGSLSYDVFVAHNLTDKTVILLLFCMNTGMFALLADMIDKHNAD
ncbi:MAG: glycosyltransferase family 2 protein [Longimicrobiales bacterium]